MPHVAAEKKDSDITGGASAIVVGFLSLTIQYLMASTHTINGINYGNAFHLTMTGIGVGLILIGLVVMTRNLLPILITRQTSQGDVNI